MRNPKNIKVGEERRGENEMEKVLPQPSARRETSPI